MEEEIVYFKERENPKVFVIVGLGELEEALPLALHKGPAPLAVDARTHPKVAFLKIIAAILEVDFADLWEREKREKKKRFALKAFLFVLVTALSLYVYTLTQVLSSNKELTEIESQIVRVKQQQNAQDLSEQEAYALSSKLKSLKESKRIKEDTLKWFGLLQTSISKKAQEVYNTKGVDEALAVLESSKSEHEDEIFAKKNMLRAKLYVEKNDFKKAGKSYEKAIAIDASYVNMYDYALFLMKEKYLTKAEKIFERLQSYDLNKVEKANVLNRLGILYRQSNQMSRAKIAYAEALDLRESLANENPKLYSNDLAWTYNNLGVLYKENHEPKASEESHENALALRQTLMFENPKKYRFYVSCSLHNMGELYACTQREGKAETLFLNSIEIRKSLRKENPKKYIYALATSYHELGLLYAQTQRDVKAEKVYIEALMLRRTLAKDNPLAYGKDYVDTLEALETLYTKTGETSKKTDMMRERAAFQSKGL